jgi:hypothetical protein
MSRTRNTADLVSHKGFDITLTTSSTSQVTMDEFGASRFRSVKYQLQVTSGSSYHTAEFIIVHNGSSTFNTEYAIIKTGDSLASFDSDISSGNVRLLVTPASTDSTTFKAIRTSINT